MGIGVAIGSKDKKPNTKINDKGRIPINFEFFFGKVLLSKQVYKVMVEQETKDEDVTFKVSDRRKFNPDGSLKEGVVLEAKPAAAEPSPAIETAAGSTSAARAATAPQTAETPAASTADEFGDEDIPGAEDPASFVNFLSTLATNAAAALGAVPHPATVQRTLDLESGKYWLDILAMLKEKTQSNLHPQEARLLEDLLGDLRMQYVRMTRVAEEKLKAQAAQKFSGADILGKK